jgi:2TM domain-containing protein
LRRRLARTEQREQIEAILARAGTEIERSLEEGGTMDEFPEMASREREARRIARRQWFWLHVAVFVPTQVILFVIWNATDARFPWFGFPLLGWG